MIILTRSLQWAWPNSILCNIALYKISIGQILEYLFKKLHKKKKSPNFAYMCKNMLTSFYKIAHIYFLFRIISMI
jgi:hypothetical protein